ncbi:MAG: hypothetical protein ABSB88_07355 [Bryobacteraceae bacterium]
MNPEPLSAPRTIVSPRLPFTMPTHQLIPPAICTRSHERLRNEPNFTGRSRNTPANIIYETKPIPSDRHRRPLTLHTRQHEITKRTQFRPQPIANKTYLPPQASPIPSPSYSHATPPSPSPFAPLVILAFPMLRVRFAPCPTGFSHIGSEALGRETCLRRIGQAIGKLKTS